MNKYKNIIDNIEEDLNILNVEISNKLFFESEMELCSTFKIDSLFANLKKTLNIYKRYIYSLDPYVESNLFEKELLAEFNIKDK